MWNMIYISIKLKRLLLVRHPTPHKYPQEFVYKFLNYQQSSYN